MTNNDVINYEICCECESCHQGEFMLNFKEADNEHNGMITAIETGHAFDGAELIAKRYPWVCVEWLFSNSRFLCPDKIVAKATCHKEDTFDETTGINLAIRKLNKIAKSQREGAVKTFEAYIANQMENPAAKKQ